MAGGTTLYQLASIPESYQAAAAAGVSGSILILGGIVAGNKVRRKLDEGDVLPEAKFSFTNVMVEFVKIFRGLMHNVVGPGAEIYLPIILATFLLVLVNNLSGLVPGLMSPSSNSIQGLLNNAMMAVFIFVAYNYFGFKEHGIKYLAHFTGGLPPKGYGFFITAFLAVVGAMVFLIELVGHIVRPVSLSLRLWGTTTGDHALHSVTVAMIPLIFPLIAMALGLLVSVVQALVFSLLSTVYIKLAVSHDH